MVSTKSMLACTVLLFAMASGSHAEPLPTQNTLDTPVDTATVSTSSAEASRSGCGPSQSEDKNLPCVAAESTTAENLLERGDEAAMLI